MPMQKIPTTNGSGDTADMFGQQPDYRTKTQYKSKRDAVDAALGTTYNFNGQSYATLQEAEAAQNNYRAALNADAASVGYDADRFDALMQSGNALSQMSTDEFDYIKKNFEESTKYSKAKYTKSDTDAYLASVGLPPLSSLSTYRDNYAKYMANGDFSSSYGRVTKSQWDTINKLWKKDWVYTASAEDQRRKAQGLPPVEYDSMYGNTKLDEELKARGYAPYKLLSGKLGEKYASYATGGIKDVFGGMSDEAWNSLRDFWKRDWDAEYTTAAEDQRRKENGEPPMSYDDMYEDTQIDEELKAAGLPPMKLLTGEKGTLVKKYNEYMTDSATYNEVMDHFVREYIARESFESRLLDVMPVWNGDYDYENEDITQGLIEKLLTDPEYAGFVKDHFYTTDAIPDPHDHKYIVYTTDSLGDKVPVRDANGNIVYDSNAYYDDLAKAGKHNSQIANDEFAITPESVAQYIAENGVSVRADMAAERHFRDNNIDFDFATRGTNQQYLDVYRNFATAFAIEADGGLTIDTLFTDEAGNPINFTPEERKELQPLVDKANRKMVQDGVDAAEEYLSGGEFAADMRKISEDRIVASYRELYADVDGYNEPGNANYHDDEKILNDHYTGIAEDYLMTDDMPLEEAVAKLRSGELTLDTYLSEKCATPEQAEEFAKKLNKKHRIDNNIPIGTFYEYDLDKKIKQRGAAYTEAQKYHMVGLDKPGGYYEDLFVSPDKFYGDLEYWEKIANRYNSRSEAYDADERGDMPENDDAFLSASEEWEYAKSFAEERKKISPFYEDIIKLDPDWGNDAWVDEYRKGWKFGEESSGNQKLKGYEASTIAQMLTHTPGYNEMKDSPDEIDRKARNLFKAAANVSFIDLSGDKTIDELVDTLTDEEKKKLVYLGSYYSIGSAVMTDYIRYSLQKTADQRRRQLQQENAGSWGDKAKTGFGRVVRNGLQTVTDALFVQPTEGVVNFVVDSFNMLNKYDLLASSRANTANDHYANIASGIEQRSGKVAAYLYNLVPSTIQSIGQLALAYVTKGASANITLAIMATESYSSTVDEALRNGATSDQAYALGIASGIAEYMTEKVSLDAFIDAANPALDSIRAAIAHAKKNGTKVVIDRALFAQAIRTGLLNMGKQGLVEMSEETLSGICGFISEQAILGFDSSYEKAVQHYMSGGMSEEAARDRASKEVLAEIALEGLAGFITGSLMSGGQNLFLTTTAAGSKYIDRTGIGDFLSGTHDLSMISFDDAMNYVRSNIDMVGNTTITASQVQSVMNALIKNGADAATLARVRNEIMSTGTTAAVNTVMNNIVRTQTINDGTRLVNAAEKYISKTAKSYNTKSPVSRATISNVANDYLNALQNRVQDRDVKDINKAASQLRGQFVDSIQRLAGKNTTVLGMRAVEGYITTLSKEQQATINKDAERFKNKFNSAGMTGLDAGKYSILASAIYNAARNSDSATALSGLFGEGATYSATAIENACLNSTGEDTTAFINSVCDAVNSALNANEGHLSAMTMNGLNVDAVSFAATQMAIAHEATEGTRSRALYDYIEKFGATTELMDLLTAANMMDSMDATQRHMLQASVRTSNNSFMTADQVNAVTNEYNDARNAYEDQQKIMKAHQEADAQALSAEEGRVAGYAAKIAAITEADGSVDSELAKTASDLVEAKGQAEDALNKLKAEQAKRMASTQKDLNSAKSKYDSAKSRYTGAMQRHAASMIQRMGDVYQGIMAHDHLSQVSLASRMAEVMYAPDANLNDINEKIRASEQEAAVALGRDLGVTVEIVEFSEEFFDEKKVTKGNRRYDAPGVTIGGKVYLNEKNITSEVGSGTNAVILHEISHVMEASADNYRKYMKFARQYFEKMAGKEYVDKWVNRLVEQGMTQEKAEKELAAEFSRQAALADPRAIKALVKSAPVMSTRIFQWLTNKSSRLDARALSMATALRDAQREFARAVKDVRGKNVNVSAVSNIDELTTGESTKNANEVLNERAKYAEQQTKTEAKTETKTETKETEKTETPVAETTETTKTEETPTETTETREPEQRIEPTVAEETETVAEEPAAEQAEDFADIEDEEAIDTSSKTEYNNNEVNVNASGETVERRVRSALQGSEGQVQYDDGQRAEADARADSERVEVLQPEGDRGLSQNGLDGRDNRGENLRLLNDHREAFQKKDSGHFEMKETDDHQRFSDALSNMRENNIEGASVDPKSVDELSGMTTLLTDDNSAGVAVAPNGNITGLFKNRKINSNKNAGIDLMFAAIASGGDRCDCYGPFLANRYANAGMVPVARVQYARGFNPEMDAYIDEMRAKGKAGFETDPDIYFMRVQPGMSFEDLVNAYESGNTKQYTKEELDALPLFEDSDGEYGYDRAEAYRDALIEKDNGTDAQYMTEFKTDSEYMDLAEKYENAHGEQKYYIEQDIERVLKAVANKNGYTTPMVYHGTPSFGFTVFDTKQQHAWTKKGYIYASTKRNVAANYAGDQHYAAVREIGTKYDGGSSIESIIKDARTIFGAKYRVPTETDIANRIRDDYKKATDIEAKFNELGTTDADLPQEVANAIARYEDVVFTLTGNDFAWKDGVDGIINASAEDKVAIKEWLDEDFRLLERSREIIRDYFAKHRNELSEHDKNLFRYLMSYEVGDAYIDIKYGLYQLLTPDNLLVSETGNWNDRTELRESMDQTHNIGAYQLYGDLGSKPFIFDADGAQFWALKVPEVSDGYTDTDAVCKWAKENGYTSVVMKNIYDYGEKADNYVFFNSEQVKSADPVTYDDNGNIIPLSERFNTKNEDIRYYTEFKADPLAENVQRNIDSMSATELTMAGNPRVMASDNGYVVVRTFSKDGVATGNPFANGKGPQNIAMIAPVSVFPNGFVDMPVPASQCTAVVMPNTDEYAEARTAARDAGAVVYGYDPSDPSMFERAIDRAKDAPSVQYMPTQSFDDFLKEYGAIPYGAEPRAQNRPVPRQTTDKNRVSRMASNAATSPVTTDEGYGDIKGWIANNGTGTYEPQSNARTLEKARGTIARAGDVHQAAADLDRDVATGYGKATDLLARAELLYAEAQNPDNDLSIVEREKIFGNLCIIASDAGRALQLATRLKYMTADGHIAYIEQVGKRMAEKYQKRTKKFVDLNLTDEEKEAYRNAVSEEQREEIDERVGKRFAEETSDLSFLDKIRNWRYFAMLGNARTHFRNMIGNALMNPVARVKDTINAGYQWIGEHVGREDLRLSQADRTSAAITKRVDADTKEWVNARLKEALPLMQNASTKYMEEISKPNAETGEAHGTWFERLKATLTQAVPGARLSNSNRGLGRILNTLSFINSNALELEDAMALSRRFRSVMYQLLQARGLDVNTITEEQTRSIVDYASQEALRATFRDASALADALNRLANTNQATRFMMEAVMPFKRTPINIAKRAIEYSPIGLINGAYKLFSNTAQMNADMKRLEASNLSDADKQARREEILRTHKQQKIAAIDRLAAGTTGSILTALGFFASAMGWISIGRKDDEASQFEKSLGKNDYSLNIGNLSIDLSAFSPAAVPLLMGTALAQATDADRDGQFVSSMISALCESVDPVTEMSMLSGIADALSGVSGSQYEDGGKTRWFGTIAGNAIESYVGQFVPTFVGQIERTIDPYARSYSAGDEYWASKVFGSEIGTAVKGLQNKVGLGWLSEPKVDIHGEPVRNYTNFGSWVLNTANNTILPATIKVERKTEIDDELLRLYGVVDNNKLFPSKPSRNLGSYTDKQTGKPVTIKLTNDDEYMQYQMEYGQTVYDMLEELMASPSYQRMTDVQKAEAVEKVIDNAATATRKRWKAQKMK